MTTPYVAESGPVATFLWRGAMYELLADALTYPEADTMEAVGEALADLQAHPATNVAGFAAPLSAVAAAFTEAGPDELLAAFSRLFAGEVACSACETEYDFDTFAKARQLADIAGFYLAFGLKVAESRPAPADMVSTELEFMSHLALKQAYAAVNGMSEQAEISADAERAFLEAHLGRWMPAFCRDLGRFEAGGFYAAVADLCGRFVAAEVERVGAHPRAPLGRRTQALEAEAFTCGLAVDGEESGSEEQQ